MTEIRPEICYTFVPLTLEDIKDAHIKGTTVTGIVEKILPNQEIIEVRLGDDIVATLPFSEATMYPLRYSKRSKSTLPSNIRCLSYKKIRAKITEVSESGIILSRKQNMIEAYVSRKQNMIEALQHAPIVSMYVTETIEKSAFGDVGEGLTGKMLINEVCRTHIHHVKHRIKTGTIIDVAMLGVDNENRFAVSYRQMFKPFCKEDYPVGTVLTGTVGDWIRVTDTSLYYMEITPQVPGILTINEHMHLDYGTKVKCVVTEVTDKGLYLELVNVD